VRLVFGTLTWKRGVSFLLFALTRSCPPLWMFCSRRLDGSTVARSAGGEPCELPVPRQPSIEDLRRPSIIHCRFPVVGTFCLEPFLLLRLRLVQRRSHVAAVKQNIQRESVQRLKRISTYHLGDFEVVVEMLSVVGFGSSLGSISMEEYRELQICARLAKLKGAIPDTASSEV